MGIARSTYYDAAPAPTDDTAIVEAIAAICEEFECYGWRRVRAALQQQGMFVNHKKIKRLMREHGLQPRIRRRYVATTDSDHDQPIFPNRTKDVIVDRPDRLWVADITYVAIALHLCGPEHRINSQTFSCAQSRDQAAVLFSLAAKIVPRRKNAAAAWARLRAGAQRMRLCAGRPQEAAASSPRKRH
jgi:HTH-like domain